MLRCVFLLVLLPGAALPASPLNDRFAPWEHLEELHDKSQAMQRDPFYAEEAPPSASFAQASYAQRNFSATPGTVAGNADRYGGLVGYDYTFNSHLCVGLAVGYERLALDATDGSELDGDTFAGLAYASWLPEHSFSVDAMAGYGHGSFESQRNAGAAFAVADIEQHQLGTGLRARGHWQRGELRYGPEATLQWAYFQTESYRESGPGLAPQARNDRSQQSLRSAIGAYLAYPLESVSHRFVPEVSVLWVHEFLDSTATISPDTGGLRNLTPTDLPRDHLRIQAGGRYQIGESFTLGAFYSRTLLMDEQTEHIVKLSLSRLF